MKKVLDSVETAFAAYAKREVQMPAKKYLFFAQGDLRIMPCYVRGREEAAVKCVNVHPQNPVKHELPTVMAIIELIDPETGFPLAVMDGTWITDMRTGGSAGVATKYLARPDSDTLGIIGAGRQACTQLMAMNEVMKIEKAKVYCRTCSTRTNFARNATETYGFEVEAVDSPQEAVKDVDVVVTTTPSRKPLIKANWIRSGTHINAMGADAPSKPKQKSKAAPSVLRTSPPNSKVRNLGETRRWAFAANGISQGLIIHPSSFTLAQNDKCWVSHPCFWAAGGVVLSGGPIFTCWNEE